MCLGPGARRAVDPAGCGAGSKVMTASAPLPPVPDLPDPALLRPPPAVPLRTIPSALATPTAAIFGTLSRLRGKRAMHPVGVVRSARLTVPADAGLPAQWRALDGAQGIVRLSKSVGTPRGVPDVLGVALRFGDQDLLLASALRPPLAQHLLVPAAGFDRTTFSSLLPHRVGTGVAVIQARLTAWLPPAQDALEAVSTAPSLRLLLSAVGLLGRRRALGTVDVGPVDASDAAARVRFDPWRAGAGLTPAGPLQGLRAPAYAASRRATTR